MSIWKDVVRTVAPTIASAFGTPLAGLATAAVASALNISDSSQEKVVKAIENASPEDLKALKQAEIDFSNKMKELDVDVFELTIQDKISARKREVALRDKIPAVLSLTVTGGFFFVLWYMLRAEVPKESKDVLNILLGSLGTAWIQVMSYYFGSSSGSTTKTEILGAKIK